MVDSPNNNDSNSVKLLPCPFCGGEASLDTASEIIDDPYSDERDFFFHCTNYFYCGIEGPNRGDTLGAISAWNTRPSLSNGDRDEG